MLPQNQRIPRKLFSQFQKGGACVKNDLFLLRFVSSLDYSRRFCFSVSKKVAKTAVLRNRLRRWGYRLLEKYIPNIKPNFLLTFSFRKVPKNEEEIENGIYTALKDSKLIK